MIQEIPETNGREGHLSGREKRVVVGLKEIINPIEIE